MITRLLTCAALGGLALAACSADKTDFQKKATEVIVKELEKTNDDVTASCDKPASTDVGTTFDCTATLKDGTTVPIQAEITKKNEVTVSDAPADAPAMIAAQFVSEATEAGFDVDRECIVGFAKQLSAEDRALIAEDSDAELSPAGEALTGQAFAECVTITDEARAFFAESVSDEIGLTDEAQRQCVADAIDKLSDDEVLEFLASGGEGELPGTLEADVTACA